MKHIEEIFQSKVMNFSFDDKKGELEIELEDDIGATDFLIMQLAAIHVGSYCINHEQEDMDFAIKTFQNLDSVFSYLKNKMINHVAIVSEEEFKSPEDYMSHFNLCFYSNNQDFKQRLVFTFDMPDLQLEENESCYVCLTLDIINSNYDFYE
jgi:hypothetical protein